MGEDTNNEEQKPKKKFLGIYFNCCHIYGRLYANKDSTAYVGRCPKCLRPMRVPIGQEAENGQQITDRRFFRAD